ncbi:acyltransferase [Photobacterium sp. DNB23_23_1]|uniref:Acyltransferase family protein n=1 Tax=Photobacterium pectinilyticum TaxID=2906793 RepID=A0ABT1N349_9GAMM|nr:acyltransferase family protein [Photobacterium sp. ZSDE20]MCQ1059173.1 acyltransferase family protein [Photobacterium sp. ZSDE20]MDD1824825.1 acyltransferase family protein [Photobacterium sp. ZSDE20]
MWANNLRVFSVFAVVLLHVASDFVSDIDIINPIYGNRSWWAGNIYASLTMWCIPLFIMISGYFLLNKTESNAVFFRKRVRKIFIPFVFWSLFYSLWVILKYFFKGDISTAYFTVAKGWALGEPYYHLWYLFMVPFLYLVTPILRVIISAVEKNELLVFISISFALAMLSALSNVVLLYFDLSAKVSLFTNDFLSYLGYYCLGGYIAKYAIKPKIIRCIIMFAVALFTTVVGSYYITYIYFYSYLSVNVVVASVALFFIIKEYSNNDLKLNRFAELSLGIYLIHPLFIKAISTFGEEWLLTKVDVYLYIPLASSLVFILSYMTASCMSRVRYLNRCI